METPVSKAMWRIDWMVIPYIMNLTWSFFSSMALIVAFITAESVMLWLESTAGEFSPSFLCFRLKEA